METLSQRLAGKKGAVVVFWSGICSHCGRCDAYFNGLTGPRPELGFVAVASRQNETAIRERGSPIAGSRSRPRAFS